MSKILSRKDRKSIFRLLLAWHGTVCPNRYRSGGVTIVGGNGKIDINNTFDERLKLLESDALPTVRTILFGKNENRKFHD